MAGGTSNATAGGGDHDSHHSPPFFLVGENDPNTLAAFIGGFIVLFGFVSFIVKQRLFISETIVATVFGIIAGPKCLNIFNPAAWGDTTSMTYYFAQSVCAIQIMAAAINLPKKFWISRWKSVLILLGPVMIYEYIITAVCVYLILGIPFLESLIIASCTAPTDPVLANAIVNGRFAELHISVPIRHLLSGESAANDGLAIPMFMLPVLLLQHADHPGEAIGKWFYVTWLYEVGVGAIAGLLIGLGVRVALKFADMRRWIDKNNFLSFEIALAVFIIGFASLFGVASFLTTFTAGLVFAWDDWFTEQREEAHVQEAIDMLLNLTFFLYFGTVIPFESFNTDLIPIWKLCLAGIVVMIVRRVPIVFIFQRYLGGVFTYQEAFFVGWFGPVGVGALWYMAYGMQFFPNNVYFIPVVSFFVLSSVIIHGITAPFVHVTLLTVSHTRSRSRGGDLSVPAWPSDIPHSTSAISGPILQAGLVPFSSKPIAPFFPSASTTPTPVPPLTNSSTFASGNSLGSETLVQMEESLERFDTGHNSVRQPTPPSSTQRMGAGQWILHTLNRIMEDGGQRRRRSRSRRRRRRDNSIERQAPGTTIISGRAMSGRRGNYTLDSVIDSQAAIEQILRGNERRDKKEKSKLGEPEEVEERRGREPTRRLPPTETETETEEEEVADDDDEEEEDDGLVMKRIGTGQRIPNSDGEGFTLDDDSDYGLPLGPDFSSGPPEGHHRLGDTTDEEGGSTSASAPIRVGSSSSFRPLMPPPPLPESQLLDSWEGELDRVGSSGSISRLMKVESNPSIRQSRAEAVRSSGRPPRGVSPLKPILRVGTGQLPIQPESGSEVWSRASVRGSVSGMGVSFAEDSVGTEGSRGTGGGVGGSAGGGVGGSAAPGVP